VFWEKNWKTGKEGKATQLPRKKSSRNEGGKEKGESQKAESVVNRRVPVERRADKTSGRKKDQAQDPEKRRGRGRKRESAPSP